MEPTARCAKDMHPSLLEEFNSDGHTHKHTQTYTHTHTHARARIHTHTHIHTHCKKLRVTNIYAYVRACFLKKSGLGTVKGEGDKADRGRGGKTASGNGQAWSSPSPRGQLRTEKMEETGCEVICGGPTTLAVKG